MAFLKVSGIHKALGSNQILRGPGFSQKRFQNIAIVGETGSGKSSLLKVIAGLMQPDRGEVLFEKERVEGPEEKLVPGHDGIAYLSQHFELPRFLSVRQVLTYANSIEDREAEHIYELCQIDHLLDRKTDQLSGGERQRISLARLLIAQPRLLLLDEPYSNLDILHKATLKKVIQDIGSELEITFILISHDPADALSWANEILVMQAGKLIQKGAPEKIYKEPLNPYVAGLFGKYNLLTPSAFEALGKNPGNSSAKETLRIVRPEDLEIVAREENAIKGIVRNIAYFGSHYEITLAALSPSLVSQSPSLVSSSPSFVSTSASFVSPQTTLSAEEGQFTNNLILVTARNNEWKAGDKVFVRHVKKE